jgi:hypothetical protein
MMQTFLFDDKGEIWDAKSPSLAEALQASLSGDELSKYAVKNLGFVAATESDGSVRLRLRPAVVSPTALSALLYWLHDQTIERVLISCLDGEWSHELVRSCEEAMRTLLARVKFNADDRNGDFLSVLQPLHQLQRSSPLRAALDAWSATAGKYDPEVIRPSLQKALDDRFVLVEASGGSPDLLIRDVGSGLTRLAEYWLSRARGLRVEDQPDYAYGKWVARLYQQALLRGEPLLEDVDAVVMWPNQPRQSYRYRRLVLPFKRRDGSTALLGTTLHDPAIDLRIKRNQELLQVVQ